MRSRGTHEGRFPWKSAIPSCSLGPGHPATSVHPGLSCKAFPLTLTFPKALFHPRTRTKCLHFCVMPGTRAHRPQRLKIINPQKQEGIRPDLPFFFSTSLFKTKDLLPTPPWAVIMALQLHCEQVTCLTAQPSGPRGSEAAGSTCLCLRCCLIRLC